MIQCTIKSLVWSFNLINSIIRQARRRGPTSNFFWRKDFLSSP